MAERTRKPRGVKGAKETSKKAPQDTENPATGPGVGRPDPAQQGEGEVNRRGVPLSLPAGVRAKLGESMMEERADRALFTSKQKGKLVSFVETPASRAALLILEAKLRRAYGDNGKVNRSAVIRLAIHYLEMDMRPPGSNGTPILSGLEGGDGAGE